MLKNLPKDLDDTYSRILDSIPEMYYAELRTVLMLLSFAARPMTIQEIAEATAVNLEEQVFSTNNRLGDPFDLLEICGSLVSLADIPHGLNSPFYAEGVLGWTENIPEDYKVIQFAHFSVKEYFQASRTQESITASLVLSETLSHSQITQMCLIYLLDFSGDKIVDRKQSHHSIYPFLAYSAIHWTTHLKKAKMTEQDTIEALLIRLFNPRDETHLLNLLNLHHPRQGDMSTGPVSYSLKSFNPTLYYASLYGSYPVVRFLLASLKPDELMADVINCALKGAVQGGHLEVLDLLLDAGANPGSAICDDIVTEAARTGNVVTVKKLIKAGAPVRLGDPYLGNALHAACARGNLELIKLLLDCGYDINYHSERFGTPLSRALLLNDINVVRFLLQNGADVNPAVEDRLSPLETAVCHASLETCMFLLENGAQIKPSMNLLPNAASRGGGIELMKLLLKHGADINYIGDEYYATPLLAAISYEEPKVLDFVLHEGANISLRNITGSFPIDSAISADKPNAAERLIKLGAKFGDSALEWAFFNSYSNDNEQLIKMLLDKGANPNAESTEYVYFPLWYPRYSGL